jgi:hypothetical protein
MKEKYETNEEIKKEKAKKETRKGGMNRNNEKERRNNSKEYNDKNGRKKHINVHITFHFKKDILVNHNAGVSSK